MGVEARIVLFANDTASAEHAARAAFVRVSELDSILSDYRPDSELSNLMRSGAGRPFPVGEDLYEVLLVGQGLAAQTDGAFDLTAGEVVRLWRESRRTGSLPPDSAICDARARSGWRYLQIDETARTVTLARDGIRLDAGAIGKGYAADQALATLRRLGVNQALVSLGGDLVVGDPPPGRRGWTIAVDDDSLPDGLVLSRAAVSVSGDAEQFVEIDGVRYSHVVNPRTGVGLTSGETITVVAPRGIDADAWSTAAAVLAGEARAAFIAARPEAKFYVRGAISEGMSAWTNPSTACVRESDSR